MNENYMVERIESFIQLVNESRFVFRNRFSQFYTYPLDNRGTCYFWFGGKRSVDYCKNKKQLKQKREEDDYDYEHPI